MTPDEIARALDSLSGWRGVVSCLGGEPTIHPQFPVVCDLWQQRVPRHRAGLWTSGGMGWRRTLKQIQRTFGVINYNDHSTPSAHQPIFIHGPDIVADPRRRRRYYNRCWLQHQWCPSITRHGAYFCEVAATLDGILFGGRHAWPVKPGWWRRRDFGRQRSLCEWCGIPYPLPSLSDRSTFEYATETTAPLLEARGATVMVIDRHWLGMQGTEQKYHERDGATHWVQIPFRTRIRQKLVAIPYRWKRHVWWPLVDFFTGGNNVP